MMATALKIIPTWRKYKPAVYLAEHPPPLPLAEEGEEFLTVELRVSTPKTCGQRTIY